MNKIDLSFIVPIYNGEKYIEKLIDYIALLQKMISIEIIIINDGSVDSTERCCRRLEDIYSFVHLISKTNEGQGLARNAGLRIAKGEYITFVDVDDWPEITIYPLLVEAMRKNNYEIMIGGWDSFTTEYYDNKSNENTCKQEVNQISEMDAFLWMSIGKNSVSSAVWNKLYKREFIDEWQISFMSEREVISEDYLFNLMCFFKASCVGYTSLILYHYRVNEGSYCHRYQEGYFQKLCGMKRIIDQILYEEDKKKIAYVKLFSFVKSCFIQEIIYKNTSSGTETISEICRDKESRQIFLDVDWKLLSKMDKFFLLLSKFNFAKTIYFIYRFKYKKRKLLKA